MTAEDLNEQFSIADAVEVVAGNGGLPKVRIHTAELSGEIYLHGAQVTSWNPGHKGEVIFLSEKARWQEGTAIRGGIPVCFPWFRDRAGDPSAPSHGFARTRTWKLQSVIQQEDGVKVSMVTESDAKSKQWWPGDFKLALHATFGAQLTVELEVANSGEVEFRFEEALHAYYRVGDVADVHLVGLAGAEYFDNADHNIRKFQQAEIRVTGVVDRAYINTDKTVDILDLSSSRQISVEKENSMTTVVWNPWIGGAQAFSDMNDDEWKQMVCVEPSNIRTFAIELAPGQKHSMITTIKIHEL